MSLAQHQNTCPIILGLLPTEGRSTKAFLVSAVQNFPPLPPPSSFFHLLSSRKTMNGIIRRVQLSKNAEMHAERTSFFPLSAFACDGVGEGGKGGERCCYLFQRAAPAGCNAREQQTPFQERYRGERNRCTHRVFSRVHNSLARVQWWHHLVRGGENIVFILAIR